MKGPGAVYSDCHLNAPSHGPGLPTIARFGLCLVCYCSCWKSRHAAELDFFLFQRQGQRWLHWPAAEWRLLAPVCSRLSS